MSENKNDTLQNEMENLAATFQNEYDKAAAADEHPLIQELDEIVEEEEEEEVPAETEKKKKKKKKEKKKRRPKEIIGSLLSFILVIALMATTAIVTFYTSSFLDYDSAVRSMSYAASAEDPATKIEYFKESLDYIMSDIELLEFTPSRFESDIQLIHEMITVCTVETEGYAAAMTYMHANLTDEQIASPMTDEFKSFMKIAGVFDTVAKECIDKANGADADYAAVAATYTTDETLAAAITAILENTAVAVDAENAGDLAGAATAYQAAIAGLAEYSTKSQILTERYVLCLAQTEGYAAALKYANANLTEEQLAAPVVAEFATFTGVADILAGLSETIYTTAKELVGDSAEAPADFADEIAALNAPAYVSAEIESLYANITGGLAKINEGSYASAVEMLTAAASSFNGYGCPSAAVTESVVIATAYANGYAQALAYAKTNITAAEYTPATEEYAAFLAAAEAFASIDNTQFKAVSANVATFTDAASDAVDMSGVVAALNIPDCIAADAQTILTNLARAIIAENAGDAKTALGYYKTVAENMTAIGQTATISLEKIAVLTSKTEDLHAAHVFVTENSQTLAQDAESALTEDFAALLTTLSNAFNADKVNEFIANAKTAINENGAAADVASIVTASGIDAAVADFYKAYFNPLAEAIAAEKDKNLSLAIAKYEELAALLADDSVALPESLLEGIITAAFKSGNLQNAVTYCTTYVDMENLEDGEFKTLCETVQLCDTAMQNATAVFQQAYYSSYYGTVVSREELTAQFDALLTEESNKYDTAFNYYYRYISEMYFYAENEDSIAKQREYLEKVRELIPEQIFLYGYNMIDYSIADGDYAGAKELAEEMLAINAYDDIALSLIATIARIEGDLDTAAAYIAKGVSYENTSYECERQHIILSMLSGNLADAYDSVIALYTRGLATMYECETIVVYNALFTDATDEQKTKLAEIIAYIENDLYGSYGYSYAENTTAIINGTKTAADVFLAEPYDLW